MTIDTVRIWYFRSTLGLRLSESRLSGPSFIRTVAVTVLIQYFVKSVCSIRVDQWSTVYKSIHLSEHFCDSTGTKAF